MAPDKNKNNQGDPQVFNSFFCISAAYMLYILSKMLHFHIEIFLKRLCLETLIRILFPGDPYPPRKRNVFVSLVQYLETGKLQKQLLGPHGLEDHRGLQILATAFYGLNDTDTETLMLDGLPHLQSGSGSGRS